MKFCLVVQAGLEFLDPKVLYAPVSQIAGIIGKHVPLHPSWIFELQAMILGLKLCIHFFMHLRFSHPFNFLVKVVVYCSDDLSQITDDHNVSYVSDLLIRN